MWQGCVRVHCYIHCVSRGSVLDGLCIKNSLFAHALFVAAASGSTVAVCSHHIRPDGMAKSVEHPSPILEDRGDANLVDLNPSQIKPMILKLIIVAS